MAAAPASPSAAAHSRVKVASVSSLVTEDILQTLFGCLGQVTDLRLYPSHTEDGVQECQVEFADPSAALTALHLTGTDLGDRTLFVTITAKTLTPHPLPSTPSLITNSLPSSSHFGATISPATVDMLTRNPNINPSILQFDPQKADEISRTVYIGNISTAIGEPELRAYFISCGEIVAVKMAGDQGQVHRYAFMEFANQEAAAKALQLNGMMVGERPVKVNFAKNSITKPVKRPDGPILNDPAMRRVAEAQAAIAKKYSADDEQSDVKTEITEDLKTDVKSETLKVVHLESRSASRKRSVDRGWNRDRDRSRGMHSRCLYMGCLHHRKPLLLSYQIGGLLVAGAFRVPQHTIAGAGIPGLDLAPARDPHTADIDIAHVRGIDHTVVTTSVAIMSAGAIAKAIMKAMIKYIHLAEAEKTIQTAKNDIDFVVAEMNAHQQSRAKRDVDANASESDSTAAAAGTPSRSSRRRARVEKSNRRLTDEASDTSPRPKEREETRSRSSKTARDMLPPEDTCPVKQDTPTIKKEATRSRSSETGRDSLHSGDIQSLKHETPTVEKESPMN
ncbi:hypothetical protein PhCBS80983_g00406 [Powellomyces hirtus]|uniref:RRM domain-containing protein n=1 Tax=Powellomyces hirtus TaxID=109895 RepID=A0A507EGS0_9FUNG|nr:hypothetical protein PhCBS80983_g00406 [Powellomyces hirtus]